MQLNHATLVGLDVRKMERDVFVELLEEWDPITDQDRQDRITNVVRQPETKAFGGDHAASNKPDTAELGPQTPMSRHLNLGHLPKAT
jgi:hypothetical protein